MSYVELSSEAALVAEQQTTTRVTRTRRRGQRSRVASIGLHAGVLTAVFVAVFPVIWIILTSFKPRGEAISTSVRFFSETPTLANYRDVLTNTDFPTWFVNSAIVAAGTMAIAVFVSASAGYALSRSRFPGARPLLWTFLLVQMFPVAILIVPLYNIMVRLQLLNTYPALILAYCATAVPFCTWMLKGYFDSIPYEIDEAGRLDGCTPWGVFYRLVLPLARPGLAVTAFYAFLTAWGEVAFAVTFMTTEDKYTLAVGLTTFVGQFKQEWGLLTAASILILIPAAAVFFVAQKHLVSGLTAGGTKG